MAISDKQFDLFGGAVNDLFGAAGSAAQAKAYGQSAAALDLSAARLDEAAAFSDFSAGMAKQKTAIGKLANEREVFNVLGSQGAGIVGGGFSLAGSGSDILRMTAAEGALSQQIIGQQGMLEEATYKEEAKNYRTQAQAARLDASAARAGKKGSKLGTIAKIAGAAIKVASLFSDEALKDGIVATGREAIPGVPEVEFSYKGDSKRFVGVLAQDVQKVRPDAVDRDPGTGHLRVDYGKLGIELKELTDA